MTEQKLCQWCRAPFEPVKGHQVYCSAQCRLAFAGWGRTRGARVIRMLLEADDAVLNYDLRKERARLLEEVRRFKPDKT